MTSFEPEALSGIARDKVLAFIRRNAPPTQEDFFDQLYKDLRLIIGEIESVKHEISWFNAERDRIHEREESLRTRIVGLLKARDYVATAEENIGGHPDIAVTVPNLGLRWLAECKIHEKYDNHEAGMLQLHTRYASGRCTTSSYIIFCFGTDSNGVLETWRAKILEKRICELQGEPSAIVNLEFNSLHRNKASGLNVETKHFIVSLYYAPEDAEFKQSKTGKTSRTRPAEV